MAAVLFGIDWMWNSRPAVIGNEREVASAERDKPTIHLWLNLLCCGGWLPELREALSKVSWLEAPRVLEKLSSLEPAKETPGVIHEYRQHLVLRIKDPEKNLTRVDFV